MMRQEATRFSHEDTSRSRWAGLLVLLRSLLPQFRARLCFATVIAMGGMLLGCDSPAGDDPCSENVVSKDLKRVMYWGNVSPSQDEPNHGYPTGIILDPLWYQSDRILISSLRRDQGQLIRGLFEVTIDPSKQSFVGIRTFAFPYLIRNFDYDTSTGDFALTFSLSSSNIQTVRARADEPNLAIVDTLLDESWYPLRARFVEPGGGVMAYARDPASTIAGFYFVSNNVAVVDSLLLAVDLSTSDALGFDVHAGKLVFGRTAGPLGGKTTEVAVMDLASHQGPRVVATFGGSFVSASIDPSGDYAIVSQFFDVFTPSQSGSLVQVLNLTTGKHAVVDVLTRPCLFVIADFASWDPSGTAFAFSAGAFSGEGDVFPRELWIRSRVPRP